MPDKSNYSFNEFNAVWNSLKESVEANWHTVLGRKPQHKPKMYTLSYFLRSSTVAIGILVEGCSGSKVLQSKECF